MASPLGKLLGASPIRPIQQHMQLAQDSIQELCELLSACTDGDWDRAADIYALVESTSAQTRRLRRDIRSQLPRSLWLAMPRGDILQLLDIQQRIADGVHTIAGPITLRRMEFPTAIHKSLNKLCSELAAAAGQALNAIRELDEMLEQGFSKRERLHVEKILRGLERQIERCEKQQRQFFKQICRCEPSLSSVDAMFFYRINDALAELIGDCAAVGEQLDLLLAS